MTKLQIPKGTGIPTRWLGGPLGGNIVCVPALQDVFTIEPEDNFGRSPLVGHLKRKHKYVLSNAVTIDGVPVYRYEGVVDHASSS